MIASRLRELSAASGGRPTICAGCNFHLNYSNIQDAIEQPRKYTINGSCYLLLEFPDTRIPQATPAILVRLMSRDMFPIVTHPERNPILAQDPERLAGWVEQGALVQITAKSLTGGFGNTARKATWTLLERGLAHFVASDCHDAEYRSPRLDIAFELVSRKISREAAELLVDTNPAPVIAGADSGTLYPAGPVRRRSFLGFLRG